MTDDERRLWTVTVTETATYELPIIATTAEAAERAGERFITETDDPEPWFDYMIERVAEARRHVDQSGRCPYCEQPYATHADLIAHAESDDYLAGHVAQTEDYEERLTVDHPRTMRDRPA